MMIEEKSGAEDVGRGVESALMMQRVWEGEETAGIYTKERIDALAERILE